ncbi:hypothetical protein [Spiroplasma sp. BIUS-1]|uniref:hypothetical protein n=1 Tax=Spiroplasma sp. BIUS-1 TaxID=216964 RepID=UPI0013A6B9BB|nr:hypothetical protein [Spiroplasma sp. BIUS-1]
MSLLLPLTFLTQGYVSFFSQQNSELVLKLCSIPISAIFIIMLISYVALSLFISLVNVLFKLFQKIILKIKYLTKKYLRQDNYKVDLLLIQLFKFYKKFLDLVNLKIKTVISINKIKINKSTIWVDSKQTSNF